MITDLYILAHPDDEVMCLHSIAGKSIPTQVAVIYLTNGQPYGAHFPETKRISEANKVAGYLGYLGETYFFGVELALQDGNLAGLFGIETYIRLLALVKDIGPKNVFTTSLEGGHQDHDTTYLIAKRISLDLNLNLIAFPCYSSSFCKLSMYSTMKSTHYSTIIYQDFRNRIKMCFLAIKIMAAYSTQMKTWAGLGIPIILKYAFGRLSVEQECNRNVQDVKKFLYETRRSFKSAQIRDFERQIRSWSIPL